MKNFNHKAHAFSKNNLIWLAHFSHLAYKDKNQIKTDLVGNGFSVSSDHFFISDDGTHTQAIVAGDKQKIIVAFRGTQSILKDWVTDAKIVKDTWTEFNPLGLVHSGFYQALSSVWAEIKDEIQCLRDRNQTIWFTGHSLGGALAVLAAATLELQENDANVNGVYTFGQPRVGNRQFATNFNNQMKGKTFRCVNNCDVVSRVPPQVLGYSHVGTLKYFDNDGKLRTDSSLSWWARFWDRLEGRFENLREHGDPLDGIADHSMTTYKQLSKNC